MRWRESRRSGNIEDRRGWSPGIVAGGGGGTLLLALAVFLMGGDPTAILLSGLGDQVRVEGPSSPGQEEQADFASAVLGSTEDVWGGLMREEGLAYEPPRMVLYSGYADSACGLARSAVGPFYCPNDARIYLDLDFFAELDSLHAPGDFARAYVIAHEVGHHIQALTGVEQAVARRQRAVSQRDANALSVRLELQADCYAGVWAHRADSQYRLIEPGDIEEALNAASRIGDDALQKQGQGYAVPDSFTHGTSAQRVRWFRAGFDSGRIKACDTFSGPV